MSELENMPNLDENEEVFEPSLMKKKKKKSKVTSPPLEESVQKLSLSEAKDEAPIEEETELDFSQLKKKKKKKKVIEEAPEGEDNENVEEDQIQDDDEMGEENPDLDLDEEVDTGDFVFAADGETYEEPWIHSDRDYTYDELLNRVFRILREHNPALAGGRKRYTIVPPQVAREGSKKTVFANIADICSRMRRNYDHVTQFIYAELGTSGSVDGSQRLIIKGRFQPKQIENVLRRYIVEYVTCKTCKSPETTLTKENRLYFMQCESCGSTRSVSAIKSGFQAQTGSRRAAKAKAAS